MHLSPLTVVDWLRQDKLRGVKLSKHWRVRETNFQAFITAHVVNGEASAGRRPQPLNAEGVPTMSGRGTWKPGAIGNLLADDEAS